MKKNEGNLEREVSEWKDYSETNEKQEKINLLIHSRFNLFIK
ncbi:MAG: hypothetical protein ACLTPN_03700 [Clostridia bacterium]